MVDGFQLGTLSSHQKEKKISLISPQLKKRDLKSVVVPRHWPDMQIIHVQKRLSYPEIRHPAA